MESPRLVLASTSRYRRELLDRLGLAYEAVAHLFDEDTLKGQVPDTQELALRLARGKALSLQPHHPGAFIVGSDSVLDLGGVVLSKPVTRQRAIEQLQQMRGREHRLITAMCVAGPEGVCMEHVEVFSLVVRPDLSDEALARYVDADEPLDCCGSYRIESRGMALFASIGPTAPEALTQEASVGGTDYTAIMGLPLVALVTMLRGVGFQIP